MSGNLYNNYGQYIKKQFGGRVQKVTVDAKFSCPNRDGTKSTGGCTFCNNESFGTATPMRNLDVKEQVQNGIKYDSKTLVFDCIERLEEPKNWVKEKGRYHPTFLYDWERVNDEIDTRLKVLIIKTLF